MLPDCCEPSVYGGQLWENYDPCWSQDPYWGYYYVNPESYAPQSDETGTFQETDADATAQYWPMHPYGYYCYYGYPPMYPQYYYQTEVESCNEDDSSYYVQSEVSDNNTKYEDTTEKESESSSDDSESGENNAEASNEICSANEIDTTNEHSIDKENYMNEDNSLRKDSVNEEIHDSEDETQQEEEQTTNDDISVREEQSVTEVSESESSEESTLGEDPFIVPHQLSMILEESESSCLDSQKHRERTDSACTTISDCSTTIANGLDDTDINDEDDDEGDTASSTVTVCLPLKLKFSRTENDEDVTTITVGKSKMNLESPECDSLDVSVTLDCPLPKSNPENIDVQCTITRKVSNDKLSGINEPSYIQNEEHDFDDDSDDSTTESSSETESENENDEEKIINKDKDNRILLSNNGSHNGLQIKNNCTTQELDDSDDSTTSSSSSSSEDSDSDSDNNAFTSNNELVKHDKNVLGQSHMSNDSQNSVNDMELTNTSSLKSMKSVTSMLENSFSNQKISKNHSKCKVLSTINKQSQDDSEEEEVDSGVTSDISRHISETDTEYDSFPELRKMNKYQRAATHSRLFKLLQGETGEQTDDELDEAQKELKVLNSSSPLVRDYSLRSDSSRSVDSEAVFGKREQLSLPLLSQYSGSDPDSLSCSSGLASPASPTVNERLLTELIQSLLRGKKGRCLRKLPMEKLRAAALRILQEDMDQYDTVSSSTTDSTPSGTPHDIYGNYYYDYNKYYETWGMVNLDTSDDYDIMPSKAFKGLQERAMGINSKVVGGTWAKCPRVLSAKNIAQEKMNAKANEEIVCGPDSSDRTT